jgi:hypothetical protein
VLATVLNPRFEISRAALFDTSAQVHSVQGLSALPDSLQMGVTVTRYEPGRVDMELSAAAPAGASLVASENYYPGWTATVDGKAAPIGRADYTLIGVELPAGARKVSLAFVDPAYQTGKLVTLAAIALALILLAGGVVTERRKVA